LAAVIDKNTKVRGEVNEKPAEEILVEDRRTVRSGFLLLLKLGEQIHGPILRIQHGAAVAGSGNFHRAYLECPSGNPINEKKKGDENGTGRQQVGSGLS